MALLADHRFRTQSRVLRDGGLVGQVSQTVRAGTGIALRIDGRIGRIRVGCAFHPGIVRGERGADIEVMQCQHVDGRTLEPRIPGRIHAGDDVVVGQPEVGLQVGDILQAHAG